MKRKAYLYSLTLACLLWPGLAAAHETGFAGHVAATLHFRPADRPVAEEITDIRLIDLRSIAGTFPASDCKCDLEIRRDGKLLATLPLRPEGSSLAANYTFPAAGDYELRLQGQLPAVPHFTIDYHPHINRPRGGSSQDGLLLAGAAVALTLLTIVTMKLLRPRRRQPL